MYKEKETELIQEAEVTLDRQGIIRNTKEDIQIQIAVKIGEDLERQRNQEDLEAEINEYY